MKVRCPYCGVVVQARHPRGGDGSALRPHRHTADGEVCRGSFTTLDTGEAVEE